MYFYLAKVSKRIQGKGDAETAIKSCRDLVCNWYAYFKSNKRKFYKIDFGHSAENINLTYKLYNFQI